jgi:hypothetical protein
MKTLHKITMLLLVIGLMIWSTVPVMAQDRDNLSSEKDKGWYSFNVSAQNLKDGMGNTLDIHGGGTVGMSGWILFQPVGAFNLTLVGTDGGTIILKTADGDKYTTHWEIVKTNFFCLADDYLFLRIRLNDEINGLPQELDLELTGGSRPNIGYVVVGAIFRGSGVVGIH